MDRQHFVVRLLLSLSVLGVVLPTGFRAQTPAPAFAPQQKERLKERDRLSRETDALELEGKLAQAIATAEKMLAIERALLGDVHEDVVGSLQQLARMHERRAEFAAARKYRQETIVAQTKLLGAGAWQVTDARLDLGHLETLMRLDAKARQELQQADDLIKQAGVNNKPGKHKEGAELAEKALAIRRRLLGEEARATIYAASWAAILWQGAGQFKQARPLHEQAWAAHRKTAGEDHPSTATLAHHLGMLLQAQGDFANARTRYEQAWTVRSRLWGPAHADTVQSRDALLGVLRTEAQNLQDQGEWAGAKKLRQELADLVVRCFGGASWQAVDARLDAQELDALMRLDEKGRQELAQAETSMTRALAFWKEPSKYREAAELVEKALAVRLRLLGPEARPAAWSASWAGYFRREAGEPQKARAFLDQTVTILRKTVGEQHPQTANALYNIGLLLEAQAAHAEARLYFQQAWTIRKKVLGPQHESAVQIQNGLIQLLGADARKCQQEGDLAAAKKLRQDLIELVTGIFGKESWQAVDARLDWADLEVLANLDAKARQELELADRWMKQVSARDKDGKYAEGAELAEKALAVRQRLLGQKSRPGAGCASWAAYLWDKAGQFEKARRFRALAADLHRKALGDNHPATAAEQHSLGVLLQNCKEYDAARPCFEQALAIRMKVLGTENLDTATTLHQLAVVLMRLEDPDSARTRYEEALAIRLKLLGENHADTATTMNNLGIVLKVHAEHAGAHDYFGRAYAVRKRLLGETHTHTLESRKNLLDAATHLHDLGTEHAVKGEIVIARGYLERALATRVMLQGEKHVDLIRVLTTLGNVCQNQSDFVAAHRHLEKAVALARDLPDVNPLRAALAMQGLGALLQTRGDYAGARQQFEQGLTLCKQALGEENANTAIFLSSLGGLLDVMDQRSAARAYLEQALAVRKKALGERHPKTAKSLHELGMAHVNAGDNTAARICYEQALSIQEEAWGEDHTDTARTLGGLGMLLTSQGDYVRARGFLERALAVKRKLYGDQHSQTAQSLGSIGVLLYTQGDYAAARPYYEQALAIHRKTVGDSPATASSLNNLGVLLERQGDLEAARRCHEESLAIRRKVQGAQHRDVAFSLNSLGLVLRRQNDLAAARRCLEEALAIRKKSQGEEHRDLSPSLNNLALVLLDQGDLAGARPYFEQSLAIRKKALGENHVNVALGLAMLGGLSWQEGDAGAAHAYFGQALTIDRRLLDWAAAGQSERQQLSMMRLVRERLDYCLSVAPAAHVAGDDVYAQVISWKGAVTARQRFLKQALRDPDLAPLAKQLHETTTQLAHLAFVTPDAAARPDWLRDIEKLTAEKERLERDLAGRSKSASTLPDSGPGALARLLPGDAALVDFLQYHHIAPAQEKGKWDSENRLLAFIVRPGRPVAMIELQATKPIEKALTQWREERKQRLPAAGAELRRLLWQPLEKHLADVKTVLIAPDGFLNQFPFAALPGKEPGSYLIEEMAVVVAPLPRWLPGMLTGPVKTNESEPSLLLVGDVDFAAPAGAPGKDAQAAVAAPRSGLFKDWRSLPGTRGEIATIRDSFEQRFADGKVKVLRGPAATEAAVRQWAPRHNVLHLATHGFFAPASVKSALAKATRGSGDDAFGLFDNASISGFNPGLLSGLVLAGANRPPQPDQDDGILTALAVEELDLRRVELVVLSACETGLGQVAGGEGVLGLQRAFQVAGARTVIASLWSVDDEATRKLMERFYDNLWQKKMSRAEAMRQAQLAMLRGELVRGAELDDEPTNRRLPPHYWAAFIVSGDWR